MHTALYTADRRQHATCQHVFNTAACSFVLAPLIMKFLWSHHMLSAENSFVAICKLSNLMPHTDIVQYRVAGSSLHTLPLKKIRMQVAYLLLHTVCLLGYRIGISQFEYIWNTVNIPVPALITTNRGDFERFWIIFTSHFRQVKQEKCL